MSRDEPDLPASTAVKPRRSLFLDWRALLGIGISVALLWWTFRGVDLGAVVREIGRARPVPFLLATSLTTFVFWIRAWRWKSLVDPVHRGTSFRSRFAAVSIGFMGNNLLPARIGEFARAYAFSRIEPVPLAAAFSTLVIERLFDAVFVIVALVVAMQVPSFPGLGEAAWLTSAARTLAFLVVLAFCILGLLVVFPEKTVHVMEAIAARVLPAKLRRPVIDALEAFLKGVGVLRDPGLLLRAGAWTLVLWFVNALGFWFALVAFRLDLPFTAALFLQSVIALFVSVPSGPGFFGLYHSAARIVLIDMWGRGESASLGFATGHHLAGFIPITLIGLWYARQIGMSLATVAHTEEAVEEAVEEEMDRPPPAGP